MKYIKFFEEMEIEESEFPKYGHGLSPREYKILTDLVGSYLNYYKIKVEDHYYYTKFSKYDVYYINKFGDFNKLKEYILICYYKDMNKPDEFLELLKTSKIDPSFNNNISIWWASKYGHTEIVRYLLNDPRVDPSDDSNSPIWWASKNGYIEIVKLLLKDPRVDPSADCNSAICVASYEKHTEIVKLLLSDERVTSKLTEKDRKKYT